MTTMELDADAFASYAFWSGILIVKMLLMGPSTSLLRFWYDKWASPEDVALFGRDKKSFGKTDEAIERVRRAHLNDLETIPIFLILGLIFCFTHPAAWLAKLLFMSFTLARISHSVNYAILAFMPGRLASFVVGQLINVTLAVRSIMYFCS